LICQFPDGPVRTAPTPSVSSSALIVWVPVVLESLSPWVVKAFPLRLRKYRCRQSPGW
jgi:hypothetical protein